jgi:hypothetical protein
MPSGSLVEPDLGLANDISLAHLVVAVTSISVIGFLISRVAFHPLRHIRGPFLASLLWEQERHKRRERRDSRLECQMDSVLKLRTIEAGNSPAYMPAGQLRWLF